METALLPRWDSPSDALLSLREKGKCKSEGLFPKRLGFLLPTAPNRLQFFSQFQSLKIEQMGWLTKVTEEGKGKLMVLSAQTKQCFYQQKEKKTKHTTHQTHTLPRLKIVPSLSAHGQSQHSGDICLFSHSPEHPWETSCLLQEPVIRADKARGKPQVGTQSGQVQSICKSHSNPVSSNPNLSTPEHNLFRRESMVTASLLKQKQVSQSLPLQ